MHTHFILMIVRTRSALWVHLSSPRPPFGKSYILIIFISYSLCTPTCHTQLRIIQTAYYWLDGFPNRSLRISPASKSWIEQGTGHHVHYTDTWWLATEGCKPGQHAWGIIVMFAVTVTSIVGSQSWSTSQSNSHHHQTQSSVRQIKSFTQETLYTHTFS